VTKGVSLSSLKGLNSWKLESGWIKAGVVKGKCPTAFEQTENVFVRKDGGIDRLE
jgi:hypothetical protein